MRIFLFIAALTIFLSACSQSKSKPITELSQKDIESHTVLDVRTPEEFEAGHLQGAVNIDWFDDEFEKAVRAIDKSKPILVYCKKGGRSAKAVEKLVSMGYKNVIDLTGGYDAYLENRKTLE